MVAKIQHFEVDWKFPGKPWAYFMDALSRIRLQSVAAIDIEEPSYRL
jgi:hypothetical protein